MADVRVTLTFVGRLRVGGAMLIVTSDQGQIVMRCAECADRVRGWSAPRTNAEAITAALIGAVNHGVLEHGVQDQAAAVHCPTHGDAGICRRVGNHCVVDGGAGGALEGGAPHEPQIVGMDRMGYGSCRRCGQIWPCETTRDRLKYRGNRADSAENRANMIDNG